MTSSTSSSEPLVSPPPPYARVGAGAIALAVLLPAIVVAATLAWWGRPEEAVTKESPELAACRQNMEKTDPDVVVVGNSKAGTDIDRAVLSAALPGQPRVATVSMPATGGHVWYAMLDRCVFAAASPKLVIAYSTVGALVRHTVRDTHDRDGLVAFDGAGLPAVQEKVLGADARGPFWDRVDRRQAALQAGMQHLVRDGVSGLFFAPPGADGLLAAGRAHAEPALAQVLGAEAVTDAEPARAIPVAEAAERVAAAEDLTFDASLVPEMLALTGEKGARFVFVQAPVADWKASYDRVAPAVTRELVERLNGAGAGFLDLTTLSLAASAYGDGIHMNAVGRGVLTKALGEGLTTLDALGTGPFAAAAVPRAPPTASRTGVAPTFPTPLAPIRGPHACGWQADAKGLAAVSDPVLSKAGVGASSPILVLEDGEPLTPHGKKEDFDGACKGASNHQNGLVKFSPTGGPAEVVEKRTYTLAADPAFPHRDAFGREVFWVYPGTTARFDFAERWAEPGEFAVAVVLHVAVPGEGAEVVVTGAPPVPVGADGVAVVPVPAPGGAWSVEVRSPEGGPWLLVKRVLVGDPARPWLAVGTPAAPRSLSLLKGEGTFVNADPLPTLTLTKFKPGGGKMTIAPEVVDLAVPNGDVVFKVAGIPGCSALRVAEDGVPLPKPNGALPKVKAEGGGMYVHKTFGLGLSTVDGTVPGENGRTYTVTHEPTRACFDARWVYPGDTAVFTVPPKLLAGAFQAGATVLDLTATAFVSEQAPLPEGATLRVRLTADDAVVLERAVPLANLSAGAVQVPLDTPVPADAERVTLALATAPGVPYVLVTGALLQEPVPSPFAALEKPVGAGAGAVEAR